MGHLNSNLVTVYFGKSDGTGNRGVTGISLSIDVASIKGSFSLFKQIFWFALLMCRVKNLLCLFRIKNGTLYGGSNTFDLAAFFTKTCVPDWRTLGMYICFLLCRWFVSQIGYSVNKDDVQHFLFGLKEKLSGRS